MIFEESVSQKALFKDICVCEKIPIFDKLFEDVNNYNKKYWSKLPLSYMRLFFKIYCLYRGEMSSGTIGDYGDRWFAPSQRRIIADA